MLQIFVIIIYTAREKDYYRLVDMMIAWSVIHGGPGGNFLSKTLYNALAYGIENVSADPRDLPSSTMQEKIALVSAPLIYSQI